MPSVAYGSGSLRKNVGLKAPELRGYRRRKKFLFMNEALIPGIVIPNS